MGNVPNLDSDKIRRAIMFIEHGSYVKQAVLAVGLNYNTWLSWIKKGKDGVEPYKELFERVEAAKCRAEVSHVENIYDCAMEGNVQASQWYLSRSKPQRWGKSERVEVKQDNHQTIEFISYSEAKKNENKD